MGESLVYRFVEVARMAKTADGDWQALLRLPSGQTVLRLCTDYATGRAGCETWATRNSSALIAAADRKHLEWLAAQTWRGEAATAARIELERLRAADLL